MRYQGRLEEEIKQLKEKAMKEGIRYLYTPIEERNRLAGYWDIYSPETPTLEVLMSEEFRSKLTREERACEACGKMYITYWNNNRGDELNYPGNTWCAQCIWRIVWLKGCEKAFREMEMLTIEYVHTFDWLFTLAGKKNVFLWSALQHGEYNYNRVKCLMTDLKPKRAIQEVAILAALLWNKDKMVNEKKKMVILGGGGGVGALVFEQVLEYLCECTKCGTLMLTEDAIRMSFVPWEGIFAKDVCERCFLEINKGAAVVEVPTYVLNERNEMLELKTNKLFQEHWWLFLKRKTDVLVECGALNNHPNAKELILKEEGVILSKQIDRKKLRCIYKI